MENLALIASLVLVGSSAVTSIRASRRLKKARELHADTEQMLRVAEAITGTNGRVIAAGAIPVDSAAGRALLEALKEAGAEVECGCPNHEEERRIRHAAEQAKRDGK